MLQTPRFSTRLGRWGVLALLLAALLAGPAGAEIFRVNLHNGSTVETSYQPQEASWDSGMVLLLTEVGNWIGVRKDEIESVSTEAPLRGFGVRINTTTMLLGNAPNDAVVAGAPGANGAPGNNNGTGTDAVLQALQNLYQQQQPSGAGGPSENYTIQQGVQSEQTQGIPASLISPVYSSGNQ